MQWSGKPSGALFLHMPPKIVPSHGVICAPSNTWFLGSTQMASRLVQPLLRDLWLWPMYRQTTLHRVSCSNSLHLALVPVMWVNNTVEMNHEESWAGQAASRCREHLINRWKLFAIHQSSGRWSQVNRMTNDIVHVADVTFDRLTRYEHYVVDDEATAAATSTTCWLADRCGIHRSQHKLISSRLEIVIIIIIIIITITIIKNNKFNML